MSGPVAKYCKNGLKGRHVPLSARETGKESSLGQRVKNHGNGWLMSTKPQVWIKEKNLYGRVLVVTAVNKWVEAWQECVSVPIRNLNLTLCCNWLCVMHGSGLGGIIDKVILLIWFWNGLQQNLDTEWKFTRTKLWLNWIYKKGVLPPPFNILYVLLPVRWIIKRLLTMCIPAAILVSKAFLTTGLDKNIFTTTGTMFIDLFN